MGKYTTRKTCRICESKNLTPLFSLGVQYVNDFPKPGKAYEGNQVPIELELCQDCTLVQLHHTAPQDFLYNRFYWYRSGVTQTMRNALQNVTADIESLLNLQIGDVVLDIGSNDGTLLRSYTAPALTTVGVEPATNLAEEGKQGLAYFIDDFWDAVLYLDVVEQNAKVVTALGMFYDLENPNRFIADIARVLDKDGLFVAQLMCLKNMLDLKDVGNFAHEHLEFYSFKSLEYLYGKHGLKIIDIATNTVNGQSYRIYACHKEDNVQPHPGAVERIAAVREAEKGLANPEFYKQFFQQMEDNKQKVKRFIEKLKSQGKSIWVYGASTKGNVILQYYGLDYTLIDGAAERSPEKYGRVTVGTNIPIYSEDRARQSKPDYFLILPYAFLDEFIKREKTFFERGGHFIVPLPEMRVI